MCARGGGLRLARLGRLQEVCCVRGKTSLDFVILPSGIRQSHLSAPHISWEDNIKMHWLLAHRWPATQKRGAFPLRHVTGPAFRLKSHKSRPRSRAPTASWDGAQQLRVSCESSENVRLRQEASKSGPQRRRSNSGPRTNDVEMRSEKSLLAARDGPRHTWRNVEEPFATLRSDNGSSISRALKDRWQHRSMQTQRGLPLARTDESATSSPSHCRVSVRSNGTSHEVSRKKFRAHFLWRPRAKPLSLVSRNLVSRGRVRSKPVAKNVSWRGEAQKLRFVN